MYNVLEELISPLISHVSQLLSRPASGTDDAVTHGDTKKAFLGLLNSIMTAKLQGVFLSDSTSPSFITCNGTLSIDIGNNAQFEGLMATMERLIEDISDPNSEKAALQFLGRAVAIWGNPEGTGSTINGLPPHAGSTLPGFEQFIYERLVPATFRVLSLPGFTIKDGQLMTVCSIFKIYLSL